MFDRLAQRTMVLRGVDHREKRGYETAELHMWIIARCPKSDQHFMASFHYNGSLVRPTLDEELEGIDGLYYPLTPGPLADNVLHHVCVGHLLVEWEKEHHLPEWMAAKQSVVVLKKPSGNKEVLVESDRQVQQHLVRMRTRIAHHWEYQVDLANTSQLATESSIVAAEVAFHRLNALINSINRRWETTTGR
ncbi:MAG: hypothetical protein WC817_05240 [Patescibacteria group bacterium]